MTVEQDLRSLSQASFGPTPEDLGYVMTYGMASWIDAQLMVAPSLHMPYVTTTPESRQAAWWRHALTAPDQLRQRVAFALSEILVISDAPDNMAYDVAGCTSYYDMLVTMAFGKFRDLLKAVALHPAMGRYLSHLRNRKADDSIGRTPDENFAREIMQLFSIGLWKLETDGTRVSPEEPTYTLDDITEMAKVFTGYTRQGETFFGDDPNGDLTQPMEVNATFAQHDYTSKTLLASDPSVSVETREGGSAQEDLEFAIEMLVTHPSCAPFICKQLIQRLTVSVPADTYVDDIVTEWNRVDGDLSWVVRAILLHADAAVVSTKVREPILMQTAMLRAFGCLSTSGTWSWPRPQDYLGQAALRAPSVFNFFLPSNLPAPESSLFSHVRVIQLANAWFTRTHGEGGFEDIRIDKTVYLPGSTTLRTTWGSMLDMAGASGAADAAIDFVALCLRHGALPAAERTIIKAHVDAMTGATKRLHEIIWLIMSSPNHYLS